MALPPPILLLPDVGGADLDHWMTRWIMADGDFEVVEQLDWDRPELTVWLANLNAAVAACAVPPVICAHGVGCALLAQWGIRSKRAVKGVLMVAPSDLDLPMMPPEARVFAPIPREKLKWPAIVVASRSDIMAPFPYVEKLAADWGATLVDGGAAFHFGSEAQLGVWPQGVQLIAQLMRGG